MADCQLVDTHSHLFMPPLSNNPGGVVARSADCGVTRIIVPAYDMASWQQVLALSEIENIYPALGLHPWVAAEATDISAFTTELAKVVSASKPVAIGEIGLDYKIEEFSVDQQLAVLKVQLAMAVDLDLPVILHCRGAFEDLLTTIATFTPNLRGVLHAFSRSTDLAERFIAAGLHIAFGGAISRPNAKRARQAAAILPLDKIVLETDSPSIGLDGVLPTDTEPRHVEQIARTLAELRGISFAEIAAETTVNACQLFGLDNNR